MRLLAFLLLFCTAGCSLTAQQEKQPFTVAFYNLENLFDTEDDPIINDAEFLPSGENAWTPERYAVKLKNMARVLEKLGDADGPEVVGLAEVENLRVLKDLVKTGNLEPLGYGIVHYDSPDERGIDVALLYKQSRFEVVHSHPVRVTLTGSGRDRTRDILYVKGKCGKKETIHILVNHWPSRRGGAAESEPARMAAARHARALVDSILAADPAARIAVMGDLNDDPFDKSIRETLGADSLAGTERLFNPFAAILGQGRGTLSYRGRWNLFDQVILSPGILKTEGKLSYIPGSAAIYSPQWMCVDEGRSKGVPRRTFSAGKWFEEGFSDHFPVYVHLNLR